MKGTVPQKVGRLLGNLVSHPRYVPCYFAHNVLNGKLPLDLELPWFSYAAIEFLDSWLSPPMKVCEYGSGGSTLFFARRVKSNEKFNVIVVDGTEEWIQVRPICFSRAETRIKAGGIIVVDDSWRYPQLRTNHCAKYYRTFQSVGPGRPGVTSTDVFFY